MNVARGPVLVVEDDEVMRGALKSMLESGGYAAIAVRSANEALDYLAAGTPPCLIVLDLSLPDIQGDRFYATIRADPVLAATPVLVLTGQAEPPRLPGVVATLSKGMAPEDLLGMIEAACRPAARRTSL
jgi:CheY-like chemotaxis protein